MNFSLLSFEGSRRGQSGNVFFAIFGAVVLVGLLGSAVMTFMKGPLATSVKLTKMNTAENQMAIGSQVAVMATASQLNNGDCDSDGYVEPVEWRTPTTEPVPVNGGLVPLSLGISKKDPWGTEYGYCVWNHGATTSGSGCAANMLTGATSNAYTVVALVSAGPDKTFTTTCRSFATADVNTDGDLLDAGDLPMVSKAVETDDDIIVSYTYEEATGASGGLWSIKAGDPATATIGTKNIETTGVASLQGGLLLPDKALIDCNDVTNAGVMAKNGNAIEICDGAGTWTAITGGGGGTIDALTDAITDYATLYNVFLGDLTGVNTTTGTSNTALGYNALNTNVAKGGNTAIGYEAMQYTDSAVAVTSTNNTALGYQALRGSAVAANNTGTLNTAVGQAALRSYTSGYQNTAVGRNALASTNTGFQNTAVGTQALASNTSGALNTAIGAGSLNNNLTGAYNTAVGYASLGANTGGFNTAIGQSAMESNLGGNSNTVVGQDVLKLNTTGDNNTAMGRMALYENRAGEQSVAIGYEAMRYANSTAVADTVTYNTAVGYQALMGSATPASNTGIANTAIGHKALFSNTVGSSNVAIGTNALTVNVASNNTAVGRNALAANTSGDGGTAVGFYAAASSTAASGNTAFGYRVLVANRGTGNVGLGPNALGGLDTGNNNTGIGSGVGSITLDTGSSNILIGTSSAVDTPAAATSNHLNIGNTIYGDLANDRIRIGGTGVPSAFSDLELAGTLALKVSSGTTAQRPATPANGMVRYNSTNGKIEGYENGAWTELGATTCADMTPDAMAFANLTGQTVSTLVTSAIVQAVNFGCEIGVSVTATGGSPQYRVCTDAACATVTQDWTTASTDIAANEYIQMRITTSAAGADTRAVSLSVGNLAVIWSVTTDGDCTDPSPPIGTVCSDGSVYAGLTPDGSVKMYVPRCDYGQIWDGSSCAGAVTLSSWSDGIYQSTDSPLINCGSAPACGLSGSANTITLLAADSNAGSGGIQLYGAAHACGNLNIHGQTDWYLPSIAELEVMYNNRSAIGGFSAGNYWSSSEYIFDAGAGGFQGAWIILFSNGTKGWNYKNDLRYVRCARK